MALITDLVQIKRLGDKKREENARFRVYMKRHVFVERQFRKAAQEVEDEMDCRTCGECCRVSEVELVERDIEKMSRFLGISEKDFVGQHTMQGSDGELILKRGAGGCEFLAGNECTIYEARPGNCEKFPHLLKGSASITARMWQLVDRATYCPIVYNWMEKVKGLTKFKPK